MGKNTKNARLANLRLERFRDLPEREMARVKQAVALEALRSVVMMSPTDTGRFRGAWTVTNGAEMADSVDMLADLGERLDKNGQATILRGQAEILRSRPWDFVWISNPTPYALELERGHSKQAPRGMVAVTAARLRSWLKRMR
jgi:hypothetical protein